MRPFYSGTQYMDWDEFNCCHCAKYPSDDAWQTEESRSTICPIMVALSLACIGDGEVSDEIAARMGHTGKEYNWRCTEFAPDGTEQQTPYNPGQALKSAIIHALTDPEE